MKKHPISYDDFKAEGWTEVESASSGEWSISQRENRKIFWDGGRVVCSVHEDKTTCNTLEEVTVNIDASKI